MTGPIESRHDEPNGQVVVTVKGPERRDIYRFDVADDGGMRIVMDGSHDYDGPERTTRDRGQFYGATLELYRVVSISTETGEPQEIDRAIPREVAAHLVERGAEAVRA